MRACARRAGGAHLNRYQAALGSTFSESLSTRSKNLSALCDAAHTRATPHPL